MQDVHTMPHVDLVTVLLSNYQVHHRKKDVLDIPSEEFFFAFSVGRQIFTEASGDSAISSNLQSTGSTPPGDTLAPIRCAQRACMDQLHRRPRSGATLVLNSSRLLLMF